MLKKKLNPIAIKIIILIIAIFFIDLLGQWFMIPEYSLLRNLFIKKRFIILMAGTDLKIGSNRTDTIMLSFFDLTKKRISILSLPRDTLVKIPGFGLRKLNAAYSLGSLYHKNGEKLLLKVIKNFLGIVPDYYLIIDLKGFVELIDVLGGVEITIKRRMKYEDKAGGLKIDLYPGKQLLNGEKAMEYVRYRDKKEADLGRIKRQQKFLKAIIKKFTHSSSYLKIPELLSTAFKHLKTNMSFSTGLMIANELKNIGKFKIEFETLKGHTRSHSPFFFADVKKFDDFIESFRISHNPVISPTRKKKKRPHHIAKVPGFKTKQAKILSVEVTNAKKIKTYKTHETYFTNLTTETLNFTQPGINLNLKKNKSSSFTFESNGENKDRVKNLTGEKTVHDNK